METGKVAFISCIGNNNVKKRVSGFRTCEEAVKNGFLSEECAFGCVGLGDCITTCVKGAIGKIDNRVVVDSEKCDGCGDCVSENICPQHLIRLIPADSTTFVPCSSKEKYSDKVRLICQDGCIACGECERNCPADAIHIRDHHAEIDYDKCVGCMVCATVCTRKIIVDTYHDKNMLKERTAVSHCTDCCQNENCVNACRFNAIRIENGKVSIDQSNCVGCGDCGTACPRMMIHIIPYKNTSYVDYSAGACILCGDCLENCPDKAIYIDNGNVIIEASLCSACGICNEICPTHIIKSITAECGNLLFENLKSTADEQVISEIKQTAIHADSLKDIIKSTEEIFMARKLIDGAIKKAVPYDRIACEAFLDNRDQYKADSIGKVMLTRLKRKAPDNKYVMYIDNHADALDRKPLWFICSTDKDEHLEEVFKSGYNINILFVEPADKAENIYSAAERYGDVYVAIINIHQNLAHAKKAIREAEEYGKVSIIISVSEKTILKRFVAGRGSSIDSGDDNSRERWAKSMYAEQYSVPPLISRDILITSKINYSVESRKLSSEPVQERIRHFDETFSNYSPADAIGEARRCLDCRLKPCVSYGCPNNNDIPNFIRKVKEGDFEEAYQILSKTTCLPAICGRVCQQSIQCEGSCIKERAGQSVAIGNLERFVADWHDEHAVAQSLVNEEQKEYMHKVAIIGSGPCGIAAAKVLAENGIGVTIFEKESEAGGVLMNGIPHFRLPKAKVNKAIEGLKAQGVQFKLNTSLGEENFAETKFQAVLFANGTPVSKRMNIPGENLKGVLYAVDYLKSTHQKIINKESSVTEELQGKIVTVIGGGNVAVDVSRTVLRQGAEKTIVIYRRDKNSMPADPKELSVAKDEGVDFMYLTNPVRINEGSDRNVCGITCIKMESGEINHDGKRSVKEIPGSEFLLKTDIVIMALGTGFDNSVARMNGVVLNANGAIQINDNQMTSIQGFFAGGDTVNGPSSVVKAMGSGISAANSIIEYLRERKNSVV